MNRVDTIIVGGGLAGSVLGYQLLSRGIDFVLFDGDDTKASEVAAGMYNPMVFRRLLKTWMADDLIPFARHFYREMESILQARFFHPMDYYKILGEQEGAFWMERAGLPDTKPYLKAEIEFPEGFDGVKHPYGMAQLFEAGWVNLNTMLKGLHKLFAEHDTLVHQQMDHAKLVLEENHIEYDEWQASRIVFCEGSSATKNPWLASLPFKPTKGEILTIRCEGLNVDTILNKNGFVLPLGDDLYRVGATYEWRDLSCEPTTEGRALLEEKLQNIIDLPYEVVKHDVGVRPTTNDRRPVLGALPDSSNVYIFNGLGTKGVLLAPYFANQLVEHIFNGQELHPEADIKRFFD